jgi:site-specific DNA recombinase
VSLAAQREKIAAYAKLYDLELVEVIDDPGASGKTLDRLGLTRALDMLKRGEVCGLVVAKLDRLTRSVADMAKLVDRYFGERAGKSLLSVADQVDTCTAAGRLVLNVLVSVAQWERETIAERTADALRHKRALGEVYGPVPLGFERGEGRKLVAVADEAATVDRVRELRRDGLSLRAIATKLVAEGRSTKLGGRWHAVTIAKLLRRALIGVSAAERG